MDSNQYDIIDKFSKDNSVKVQITHSTTNPWYIIKVTPLRGLWAEVEWNVSYGAVYYELERILSGMYKELTLRLCDEVSG